MKRWILITTTLLLIGLASPMVSYANEKESDASATLRSHAGADSNTEDMRVAKLEAIFRKYKSPLVPEAGYFVLTADKYDLDWRLVAAIAGVESGFGRAIPPGSYNAWGWGIPTGAQSGIGFGSWREGIATVSSGLKNKYVDRGAVTVEQMGRIYAASPAWSGNVRSFMWKIEHGAMSMEEKIPLTI